jgi:beta-mannosidase
MDQLLGGWELASGRPGAYATPEELPKEALAWQPAIVPGTVADSLGLALDSSRDLDGEDWWYRCRFQAEPREPGTESRLRFDGLATLAEVWLNGARLFVSRNMFVPRTSSLAGLLREENELVICFRSLAAELACRRPRPRWKTALVSHQNLRWVRTTLLGRIPGWTPALAPVGPWRPIVLETVHQVDLTLIDLQTEVEGTEARLRFAATVRALDGPPITDAALRIGSTVVPVSVSPRPSGTELSCDVGLPGVPLWWPHTHGSPNLVDCALDLQHGDQALSFDCGRIGFKAVAVDQRNGEVRLLVNGCPVFCRGACWTVNDFRSLVGDPEALRQALHLAQGAGANLLRVGGTMVYESDLFYSLCDELGLLVWQDFMFANMDYPFLDDGFRSEVEEEVTHQLRRLQGHPCVAVYCGGSEIEQQAAMLGLPAGEWSCSFFAETLPALCERHHAGIPYFPSTPTGGVLPFHLTAGISHYYGVGAYRRPMDDVKHAGVKFTSECLGFSNVPEDAAMAAIFGQDRPVSHHPRWKAGVPRDGGTGWDFEDIRDHYLASLFGLDPIDLRSRDPERYFALSRVTTGEVMKAVFAEWRKPTSGCGGGLVWFFKDLRPGAGWGVLDSANQPKAAYWYLKRAWAPRALLMTGEGLEGLQLHVLNESPETLSGRVELKVLRAGQQPVGQAEQAVFIPPHGACTLSADAMLAYFADLTYAYRFGPPKHDLVVARLTSEDGREVFGEDAYFPLGLGLPMREAADISVEVGRDPDGAPTVTLQSPVFLQSVSLSAEGYLPDDNHFHLAPGWRKRVRFRPDQHRTVPFKAHLGALNLGETLTLRMDA